MHARAAGLGHGDGALDAGLGYLLALFNNLRPKWILFDPPTFTATVYADAFFQLGDQKLSPGSSNVRTRWNTQLAPSLANGWGVVARFQDRVIFACVVVDPILIRKFC